MPSTYLRKPTTIISQEATRILFQPSCSRNQAFITFMWKSKYLYSRYPILSSVISFMESAMVRIDTDTTSNITICGCSYAIFNATIPIVESGAIVDMITSASAQLGFPREQSHDEESSPKINPQEGNFY